MISPGLPVASGKKCGRNHAKRGVHFLPSGGHNSSPCFTTLGTVAVAWNGMLRYQWNHGIVIRVRRDGRPSEQRIVLPKSISNIGSEREGNDGGMQSG